MKTMRIWKYMTLVIMLVWAVSTGQNASAETGAEPKGAPVMKQDPGAQAKDPVTKHLESMAKRYGLSTEQQAKIKPILLDEAAKLKKLRADTSLTAAENKVKLQKLRDDTNSKIRLILTVEQQKKRETHFKDISERHKIKESK